MDKKTAEKISAEMQAAARTIAAKYGLAFSPGRGLYSATDFNFKGSFKDVVQVSGDRPAQTATLIVHARMAGIDAHKQVLSSRDGQYYTLVDYQTRARKFPWVGQNTKGERLRFPDVTVRSQCALTQSA